MKLMLAAQEETLKTSLYRFTDIWGGSLIHYRHPLKCMDNFDEIEPDVIIFNATDFPRHWKIAAKTLRETRSRKNACFILIIDDEFSSGEADKAAYLEVNALVREEELEKNDFSLLRSLVSRYRIAPERSNGPVFHRLSTSLPLMFMNPDNLQFVSGRIEKELGNRLLFYPSEPAAIACIEKGVFIRNCSMEKEEGIETFDARVIQTGEYLELEKILKNEMKGIA